MSAQISFGDFEKVDLRVGTIVAATLNAKAKKPAYVLKIDFGSLGMKISSAQIVANHAPETLIGSQVVAVVNFEAKIVAGIRSEVLVLAAICPQSGTVLISPTKNVENGSRIS